MNFSVRQLRAFVTTARLRSFTRAAEQLHVTQPGLSGMLRELEAQLDCRLFERTTRSVATTAQGDEFLPVAQRVLRELDEAAASISRITATERRRLAVGTTPVIASSVLPQACAAFAQAYPQVTVDVHDLDRSAIYARVQTGDLDVGFGAFLNASSAIRRRRLLASPLVLISPGTAAPDDVRSLRWKALGGRSLLGLPADNPIQQLVDKQLRAHGEAVHLGAGFNHLHTLLSMVEAGAGEAVLPDFVRCAAARYRVRLQPLGAPRVAVDFYEITKAGRSASEPMAAFSACLVQVLASDRPAMV